jgi:hypothetical protein
MTTSETNNTMRGCAMGCTKIPHREPHPILLKSLRFSARLLLLERPRGGYSGARGGGNAIGRPTDPHLASLKS